ncbi:hypothetical protein B0H14DRAFT_2639135 [Mycena olivaceomarginata]|nr:hypothetical protein B0H14DRAFT_2639135 [Mycena olivaceomarginata]
MSPKNFFLAGLVSGVLLTSGAVGYPTNSSVPSAVGGAPHLKEVWGGPHPVFCKMWAAPPQITTSDQREPTVSWQIPESSVRFNNVYLPICQNWKYTMLKLEVMDHEFPNTCISEELIFFRVLVLSFNLHLWGSTTKHPDGLSSRNRRKAGGSHPPSALEPPSFPRSDNNRESIAPANTTSVNTEQLFSFSGGTIMKLRNQLSEKSAHSAVMVGQWASDPDLIAVDEFESQLVEGWTHKKKQRAPASPEAQGSSKVIVVEDNRS